MESEVVLGRGSSSRRQAYGERELVLRRENMYFYLRGIYECRYIRCQPLEI